MREMKSAVLASTLAVLVTTSPGRAAGAPGESMAKRLAAIRHEQALVWAKQDGVQLPASVQDFFRAAQEGTWAAVRAPDKAVSAERPLENHWVSQSVLDVYGAYEQEDFWRPDLLDQFARDVLRDIPDGSIYFGSTEAGTFTVTAWAAVHRPGRLFVLTPNRLTQSAYLDYLQRLCPSGIWLPTKQDVMEVRKTFDAEVKSSQRPPVSDDDSFKRMEMIGQLTKEIFERSKTNQACFIEKTYERSCLYPYLEPHGLIMKFTPGRRGSIPADVVSQDRSYWDEKERQLLADERFTACPAARRAYSTCRSAIGGLYAARAMPKESEYAFRQAIRIYPLFDRPYYRLAHEVMFPQGRFDDALALLQEQRTAGPDVHILAEIEESAEIGDKAAYEKGEKDGFNQMIDNAIEQVTEEIEKRRVLRKPD